MMNATMRRLAPACVAAALLAGCVCRTRSHEAVVKDWLRVTDEFTQTLGRLKTPKDVHANKAKLLRLAASLNKLSTETRELGVPDKEATERIDAKYKKRIEASRGALKRVTESLKPDVRAALKEIGARAPSGEAPAAADR